MPNLSQSNSGRKWVALALVVLIGINLRPFLTAPGPVLESIAADTGMGYRSLSLLTLLPMLLMGIGAFLSPPIQSAIGSRYGILIALCILMLGLLLRGVASNAQILIFTAILCGLGVAFIQAVFPGIIKLEFPAHIPAVTGLYSAMIMGGGAVGAQLMPILLGQGFAWQSAMSALAIPVLLAFILAFFVVSDTKLTRPAPGLTQQLLRRPRTWTLMIAFGLINAGYSSMVAWLAPYYSAQGFDKIQTGNMIAIMAICQAASALLLPVLARHQIDRRPWLYLTIVMQVIGFSGLAFSPLLSPVAWVGICGAGLGGSFSLMMITALDHLEKPEQAGALAALMQGGGFMIAAMGPIVTALLQQISGSFSNGWIMHIACTSIVFFIYRQLSPKKYQEAMNITTIGN